GIIEFSRAYNTQINLTHAARETARHMVIHDDGTASATTWTAASAVGRNAAPVLKGSEMTFTAAPAKCTADTMLTVTITYPLKTVTGVAKSMTLTGKAAMRCGG